MLSAQTEFLISLFLLLACAILAGEVALRLGQLALVGQLIAGVLLGPTLLGPYVGLSSVSPELSAVQLLATFFLLFLAGLEMGPGSIMRMRRSTLALGVTMFFVPFLLTLALLPRISPGIGFLTSAFVAITLSITALPVMAVMVKELGLVGKEFGERVMGAALVNELSAVTVFALFLQVYDSGARLTWISFAASLDATGLFLGVVVAAYLILKYVGQSAGWRAATGRLSQSIRTQEPGFAILMILSLGAALLSQALGLTFVIGAFYAGLLVTPESIGPKVYDSLRRTLSVFMWGLFIPLFFAITGVQVNLRLLVTPLAAGVFAALLVVAIVSKLGVGASVGRFGLRWGGSDSLALGFLVNSRGAVEIAMAVILYTDGVLSTFWFTVVVSVGLVCTLVAPIGAVAAWRSTARGRADLLERAPHLGVRGVLLAPSDEALDSGAPPA